jgi:hypothetical protein
MFSLLMPTFSLPYAPRLLTLTLLRLRNAPLPIKKTLSHIFGAQLEPRIFSAQNRLTSELLRTLSRVAASKPTSWLSMRLHLLNHLAVTWGP